MALPVSRSATRLWLDGRMLGNEATAGPGASEAAMAPLDIEAQTEKRGGFPQVQ